MEREEILTAYRVKDAKRSVRSECAEIAFNYSKYTLDDALNLPQGDRRILLTYARLHRAEELLELIAVFTAAQSKEGYASLAGQLNSQIKKLSEQL